MGHNISGIIKSIRSLMRGDKGVNGDAQRIEQLGWMIFLKIFDDKDIEMELLDDAYISPIPTELQWRNWASDDEGLTGEDLFDFINTDLFPTLQKLALGTTNKRAILVREIFEGNNNYMKSGTIIRQVINKLNEVNFNSSEDRHLFGDIYETILKELQSAGDSGEFYTPRAITSFITDMVDPKLGEIVFDPACGTGGFLTSAIEHIRQKEVKNIDDRLTLQHSIKGVEFKPLPHMLALTNLILHDIEVPNIEYDDALSKELSSITHKDRVDVILANPPFGGNVSDGMETNFPMTYRTKESADLFLILIIQYLKDGGRAGIVLPDGSLTGDGVKARIRQKLLEDCNLHTIVRLPNSVFQPYAAVATNLLFFKKGEPTKEIWYYEHQLPEGQKAYNKSKPIQTKEFDPIKEWWNNRVENEQAWKVDIETIKTNGHNLDIKNPHKKKYDFDDPIEILERQKNLQIGMKNNISMILVELNQISHSSTYFHLLISNLEQLLNNEKNIKHLKNFILSSAINGTLTSQWRKENPEVETASVFLQIIKAEKEKLIKEGKNKKEKPLLSIKNEEILFEIPESWLWCRLGEIGFTQTGNTPSTLEKNNFGNDIPFIKPADISLKGINYQNEGLSFKGLSQSRLIKASSVLMVCIGGSIGKSYYNETDVACNQQINTITPLGDISSVFLQFLLQSPYFQSTIWSRANTGGTPIVNKTKWETIPIPLASFDEQKIIVKKIENIFDVFDELEQQIKKFNSNTEMLMQAVLKEAFESH